GRREPQRTPNPSKAPPNAIPDPSSLATAHLSLVKGSASPLWPGSACSGLLAQRGGRRELPAPASPLGCSWNGKRGLGRARGGLHDPNNERQRVWSALVALRSHSPALGIPWHIPEQGGKLSQVPAGKWQIFPG
uniref:Uncharacterized protein n=1 Tax=Corvus moneduloides TaxID=1196302 RepID=A0A8U7NK81_CORMO